MKVVQQILLMGAVALAAFYLGRITGERESRSYQLLEDNLADAYEAKNMPAEDVALALSMSLQRTEERPDDPERYADVLHWIYWLDQVNCTRLERFNDTVPKLVKDSKLYRDQYIHLTGALAKSERSN